MFQNDAMARAIGEGMSLTREFILGSMQKGLLCTPPGEATEMVRQLFELALFGLACKEAKVVEALRRYRARLDEIPCSCVFDYVALGAEKRIVTEAVARLDELLKEGT